MRENKSLKSVDEYSKQIEYIKAKIEFLKKEIPDIQVKIHRGGISFTPRFASKSINQEYSNLEFIKGYGTLSVAPYRLLKFNYDETEELIKVHSNPGSSRLAYVSRSYIPQITTTGSSFPINIGASASNSILISGGNGGTGGVATTTTTTTINTSPWQPVNISSYNGRQLVYTVNFSKMSVNFKCNNFSNSMLNECRLSILDWLKRYPNAKLNTTHMDKKLKNLMAFT